MSNKKIGRPSKYTDELIDKCHEYIDTWQELGDAIPSHVGLALHIKVRRDTLYEWGRDENKEEFSVILDDLMKLQQRELLNKGLTGDFNSNIAKLVLGKHGYKDQKEVENKGALPITHIESEYVEPNSKD